MVSKKKVKKFERRMPTSRRLGISQKKHGTKKASRPGVKRMKRQARKRAVREAKAKSGGKARMNLEAGGAAPNSTASPDLTSTVAGTPAPPPPEEVAPPAPAPTPTPEAEPAPESPPVS